MGTTNTQSEVTVHSRTQAVALRCAVGGQSLRAVTSRHHARAIRVGSRGESGGQVVESVFPGPYCRVVRSFRGRCFRCVGCSVLPSSNVVVHQGHGLMRLRIEPTSTVVGCVVRRVGWLGSQLQEKQNCVCLSSTLKCNGYTLRGQSSARAVIAQEPSASMSAKFRVAKLSSASSSRSGALSVCRNFGDCPARRAPR